MTYDLKASFGYQLSRAARAVERGFEIELRALDLTRLQWSLLLAVGQDGVRSPSDLGTHYALDRAVVSRGVSRLCELGYLDSTAPAEDGRARVLDVTEAGRAAMEAGIEAARRNAEAMLDVLRPRPRIRILELLAEFNAAHSRSDSF